MAKLKIKVNAESSLEDIEKAFENVLNSGQKEIEFKLIKKIAEALGAEYVTRKKSGGGSRERFRHEGLLGDLYYHDGMFGVDRIHGGKGNIKVLMKDLKRFFKPAIEKIIALKRAEN